MSKLANLENRPPVDNANLLSDHFLKEERL